MLILTTFLQENKRTAAGNRRLAQWRVKWLIEHSTSHQLLWCIGSFVLRNPPLRQAPKRQAVKKLPDDSKLFGQVSLKNSKYSILKDLKLVFSQSAVLPHFRKPTAHSSTFGFYRHTKPKQKPKELEFCQCSIKTTG